MQRRRLLNTPRGSHTNLDAARRLLARLASIAGIAAIVGCAALSQLSVEISTFGTWPAGRAPGSYAFDRLPSQQAQPDAQQLLEDAARPALEKAGFRPASTSGAPPDVLVQLGARVSRAERSPWDDPLWWHGGFGAWRHSPWRGPYWGAPWYGGAFGGAFGGTYGGLGWRYQIARYEREAAMLIRDRASGQPLYEARASSEGFNGGVQALLAPLYLAALAEFPAAGAAPHRVTVSLNP